MPVILTNNPSVAAISNVVGELHSDGSFSFDNDTDAELSQPCLLRVVSDGNVKIKHVSGQLETLAGKDYINSLNVLVRKVFATDTTVPENDIRLYY